MTRRKSNMALKWEVEGEEEEAEEEEEEEEEAGIGKEHKSERTGRDKE